MFVTILKEKKNKIKLVNPRLFYMLYVRFYFEMDTEQCCDSYIFLLLVYCGIPLLYARRLTVRELNTKPIFASWIFNPVVVSKK